MNRIVKTIGLLAGASLVCSATVALAAEPSPRDVREMAKALLPHLGRPDAPGEVLFRDDFSADKLEDRWRPGGWTIVDLPGGGGRCVTDQQLPGGGYHRGQSHTLIFSSRHSVKVWD